MARFRCPCCRKYSERERRNPGKNGMTWTSNIGVMRRSEIEEAQFPSWEPFNGKGDCEECNFRPGDEDDSYTVHVTRIIIPIMDIARPAKRRRHFRKSSESEATVTSELAPEKIAIDSISLDDEEFEILSDSELWEDDWEEVHDERWAAERVTYASIVRGRGARLKEKQEVY